MSDVGCRMSDVGCQSKSRSCAAAAEGEAFSSDNGLNHSTISTSQRSLVLSITRHSQAQRLQRVCRQIAGHAQTVVALIAQDRAARSPAEDAVDRSAVITFSRQSLLRGANGVLIGRLVWTLTVVCTLTLTVVI